MGEEVSVAQTADGVDADLWKDGLFKSKVTRYLCFTRSFSKENSHLGNVLVDMKLIDAKDTLPVGFIPVQETVDTQRWLLERRGCALSLSPGIPRKLPFVIFGSWAGPSRRLLIHIHWVSHPCSHICCFPRGSAQATPGDES
uniref:Multivesicular body subunit 12B-like n=1 Tax=Castor canadensis TaxID=51338 RepID=A0A8B7TW50_CASCN|nr:multivesicular body subunit 12B-like [Castor canadensis]